jgi:hypothetical protein
LPADPLAAALSRKPRELTPDEIDIYEIGRPDERLRYRQVWDIDRLCGKLKVLAEAVATDPGDHEARQVFDRTLGEIAKVLSDPEARSIRRETVERVARTAKSAGLTPSLGELLTRYADLGGNR